MTLCPYNSSASPHPTAGYPQSWFTDPACLEYFSAPTHLVQLSAQRLFIQLCRSLLEEEGFVGGRKPVKHAE